MTPEQERELSPFLDAFAELLLAEERRRAAEQQDPNPEQEKPR